MWGSFADIVCRYTTRIASNQNLVKILYIYIDIRMWGFFADIALSCVCTVVCRYTTRIASNQNLVKILYIYIDIRMWGSFADIALSCISAAVRRYTPRISISVIISYALLRISHCLRLASPQLYVHILFESVFQ